MAKYGLILLISVLWAAGLCAQTIDRDIPIDKNYDGQNFAVFADQLERDLGIQCYFFQGWVADIRVKQSEQPSTLNAILSTTFEGTDIRYFIHPNGQVILTLGKEIQPALKLMDPSDAIAENVDGETVRADVDIQRQFEAFETEWTVIGDPTSPEQKPKVTLSGYIFSKDNGEPLAEAFIFVEELQTGTSSDSLGYYEISLPQGSYQLLFQSVGLKEAERKLKLYASGRMDVQLDVLVLELEEVVVAANHKESVLGVQMGVEAMKMETIKELPALLGEVDIIRSALMLPGVQSVGEFSSGINVRGGGADQNLILLNGAPVFNASHLFGFSSSFSPDVIEGFDLYKSSIPAKYGGRISSVLDIQMKEGNQEKPIIRGGIGPVSSRITVEGPIVKKQSSLIVSGRATYSDWILKRLENASFRNSRANYYDMTARFKTRVGKKDRLDVSAYLSRDVFKLNGDTTFGYQNRNISANYVHAFGEKLYGTFSGVFSQYDFSVDSEKEPTNSFDLSYLINYGEARSHFSYSPDKNHQVNFGLNLVHYRLNPSRIQPTAAESIVTPRELQQEKALEGSLYLSDEWTVTDAFSISAGLRYTQYAFLGAKTVFNYREDAARLEQNIIGSTDYKNGEIIKSYGGLEYRLSLRYSIGANTSLKAAVNRNRQYLSMLFNSATVSPTATWKLADQYILPQTGDQFSLGFFQNLFDDRLELSLEGYYKIIQNMVEYKAGAQLLLNEHLETDVVNGDGRAYGLEVLLKKNGRRLNGWVSYTYSRSRFRTNSVYPEDRINQGEWFPSSFDKPHDFSFVAYYKLSRRFSFASNVVYSTGRPITIPVAKYWYANGVRLQYSRRNEFRVPDYFRWDFSINFEGNHKIKKLAHSSWSLSLYNLTGRRNAYSIYFVNDGSNPKGYKLSIFGQPFLTLTYNFRI